MIPDKQLSRSLKYKKITDIKPCIISVNIKMKIPDTSMAIGSGPTILALNEIIIKQL